MAAGRIVISEYAPARDRDDTLVAGAKMFVYNNETTTLATIYAGADLTTPLANPVVANASGQFAQVWADNTLTYSVSITGPEGQSIGNPSVFDDYSPSTNFAVSEVLEYKAPVRVASTANITIASALINGSTIDGVVVATGDRVLLKDQSTGSQNGIYVVVASGAAMRSGDADTSAKVMSGMTMFVSEGTANGGAVFTLTTANPIVLDTTSLTFSRYSGIGILPVANGGTGSSTATTANRVFGTFDTRALAIAASIAADLNTVVLRGYAAAGDCPPQTYKRVGSEPSHAGKFQDALGAWFELVPEGDADIRAFGAAASASASTNVTAIQAACDAFSNIYIPPLTFNINAPILLNDRQMLRFASRAANFTGTGSHAILAGKTTGGTVRRFQQTVISGTLDGTNKATAGGIGLDMTACTMWKVYGTEVRNVEIGVAWNATSGMESCYYNELHAVDIITVGTGIKSNALGNDNKMFGGRINDCTYGTVDDDNAGNSYYGVAIETFATAGHLNSATTAAVSIRYVGSRLENAPTSGIGVDIRAAAQDTYVEAVQTQGLTTNISDLGVRTNVVGCSEYMKVSGGSQIKTMFAVPVTKEILSLAAGAFRDEVFTVPGYLPPASGENDYVSFTCGASWPGGLMNVGVIAGSANLVYVRLYNGGGGATSNYTDKHLFQITRVKN